MATNHIKKEKAGDIIKSKEFLLKCPNVTSFMNILFMDIDIDSKQVGKKFKYPVNLAVRDRCMLQHHGLIMDFFIRKVLAQKYNLNLKDDYAEQILKDVDLYFTPLVTRVISRKKFEEQYNIFKNSKSQAMVILESIKIASLSKMLYLKDLQMHTKMAFANTKNLQEVQKYFENLHYSDAEVKCNIDCKYFEANADIIFDGKVLYEIKTSKNSFVDRYKDDSRFTKIFWKLIFYGFGYYKKTNIIIKKFIIYNPLLGEEVILNLKDIDMQHFEEVLDKDIKKLNT